MLNFWTQPNSFPHFISSRLLSPQAGETLWSLLFSLQTYFHSQTFFIKLLEGRKKKKKLAFFLFIKKEQIVVNLKILLIFFKIWLFHKYLLQLHNVYVQESHLGKNSTFFGVPEHDTR